MLAREITGRHGSTDRMVQTKEYDKLNRLSAIVSQPRGAQQLPWGFGYGYNLANQRENVILNDGSTWQYDYDRLGQVVSAKREWNDGAPVAGQQFEYDFDDIGNRTAARRGGDGNGESLRETDYAANDLNQYTRIAYSGYADVVGIAAAGANVTVNANQGVHRKGEYFWSELAVDNTSAAQWLSVNASASDGTNTSAAITGNLFIMPDPGINNIAHDDDGNLTQDGRWTYTWDAENRLVMMESLETAPSPSRRKLEFKYDWRGRRIYKKVTNLHTQAVMAERKYVYDGWNLIAELDGASALVQSYLWGLDLSGSMQGAGGVGGLLGVKPAGAAVHFVAYDGNGNVAGLVDGSNGTITASYEYGAFGEPIRSTGVMAKANSFRFSTKYTDEESGHVYYGYRYYEPGTGRWLSRDPIEEEGGLALYGIVGNNPTTFIDLLGQDIYIMTTGEGLDYTGFAEKVLEFSKTYRRLRYAL